MMSLGLTNAQNTTAATDFAGQWTSKYTGAASLLYICIDPADLNTTGPYHAQGLYSQAGFIDGLISLVSGSWTFIGSYYEAGAVFNVYRHFAVNPPQGTVTYVLKDSNTISATYTPLGLPVQTFTHTRANTAPANDLQCLADFNPIDGDSINGVWAINGTANGLLYSICVTENATIGSYYSPSGSNTFGGLFGTCFLNGTLCTVDFGGTSATGSIGLLRLLQGNLYIFTWKYPSMDTFVYYANPFSAWISQPGSIQVSGYPQLCAVYYVLVAAGNAVASSLLLILACIFAIILMF